MGPLCGCSEGSDSGVCGDGDSSDHALCGASLAQGAWCCDAAATCRGSGSGAIPAAAAAASAPAPAAARTASCGLSSISEEAPSCAPHPSKRLRVEGFLQSIEAQRQEWISATLSKLEEGVPAAAEAAGRAAAPPSVVTAAAVSKELPLPEAEEGTPDTRPARDANPCNRGSGVRTGLCQA